MRFLIMLGISVVLGLLTGCKEEDTPLDDQRKATILLSKRWEVASVLIDDADVTDLGYSLLLLSFNENGTWTSSNSNGLFADEGSWEFATISNVPDLTKITLSGKEVRIVLNPEGSTLTLNFDREANERIGGRLAQSGGRYEIYMLPKFVPGD